MQSKNTPEPKSKLEISDRYSATGTPYPDENSCDECEGMGVVPCQVAKLNAYAVQASDKRVTVIGQVEEDGTPMPDDGWVFLQCPVCKGSRKKPEEQTDAE